MTRVMSVFLAVAASALLLAGCGATPRPGGQSEGPVSGPAQPIQLGSANPSAFFELENTADESLEWRIETSQAEDNPQGGAWFEIEPRAGVLGPYERQLVTLSQIEGVAGGSYRTLLSVTYRGGETTFEVIGEVAGGGGSKDGTATVSGRLATDNSLIPIDPASGFSASALGSAARGQNIQPQAGAGRHALAVDNQLIVAFEPGVSPLSTGSGESPAEPLLRRHSLTVLNEDENAGTLLVTVPEGVDLRTAAAELESDPKVRYAQPNHYFYPHALPNDPLLRDAWHLPVMGAPVAWAAGSAIADVPVVAVLDTGIDLGHEDLSGSFVSGGYDFCASQDCGSRDADPRPESSYVTHGTHVAGLLAAKLGNGRGSGGVIPNNARVLPIKVFHEDASTAAALSEAIRWAAGISVSGVPENRHPAQIITLSLGAEVDDPTVAGAIRAASDRGSLVIASAGNQGERDVDYPARYEEVIGVGAVNSNFRRSCFSDYGPGLDIMAPGGDGYLCQAPRNEALLSTFPGNDYGVDAGTSMAAPLVAGAAALAWAEMSAPTADRVRERLITTAYFNSDYMNEDSYGAGVVRADVALGFPGPGDQATVQAIGPSTALATVTLDQWGSSSTYRLENLAAGSYRIEADAAGRSRALSGALTLSLEKGQEASSVTIRLEP